MPDEVVKPVAVALYRAYDSEFNADHLSWRDFAGQARELIDVASPHIERQVRAEVAAELRQDADAHRRVVERKPTEYDAARLARARTLDDAAARISRTARGGLVSADKRLDDVPDEWRKRITDAITRLCRTHPLTVEGAAEAVLPLFADEHERARQAEEAEFTALRRAERAEAAIERVRALHVTVRCDCPTCERQTRCGQCHVPEPCPTIAALDQLEETHV